MFSWLVPACKLSNLRGFLPLRGIRKIEIVFPGTCLVTVTNSNVKRYIRFGANQNNGSPQTDIFIVDKDGKLDVNTPIIWDFDRITDITALPIDETTLTITGGHFTTIANRAESKYNYYSRGIAIRRSNVIVTGLEHRRRRPWSTLWWLHQYRRLRLRDDPEYHPDRA
jgi:hypothetical protein